MSVGELENLGSSLYEYDPRIEVEGMGSETEHSRNFVSRHLPRALSRTANWLSRYMPYAPNALRRLRRVKVVPEERGLGGYVNPEQADIFVVNGRAIRENPNFIWHTLYHEPVHIAQVLGGVTRKYTEAAVEYLSKMYSEIYGRINPRLGKLGKLVGLIEGMKTSKELIEGSASLATYESTGEESHDAYGQMGWRGYVRRVANSLPDGWRKVFNPRDKAEAREVVRTYLSVKYA